MSPHFSHKLSLVALVLLLLVNVITVHSEEADDEEADEATEEEPKIPDNFQTIKFSPADLTDEDQHSLHMPRDLKCDGCRIVAYLLSDRFQKMTEKFKKSKRKFTESEVLDMVDYVCTDEGNRYQEYGVKDINGQRRLSGPGLETKDVPGIMQGGGRWPHRLQQMCAEYAGELGEEEIFSAWQSGQHLDDFICRSEQLGSICPPKQKKKSEL
ncbi:hypothetical protein BaRGS_00033601 [Batillaria attramentaria]|uniref:Uncharacterized protein n=1 Tax=Batillaria attramentaria TaxID=370345 RepID=A0ABD0JKG4_9CAEN